MYKKIISSLLLIATSWLICADKLYVLNASSDNISVINGAIDTGPIATISVGSRPIDIAFDTLLHKAYVANILTSSVGSISVIDTLTDTPVATIDAGGDNPIAVICIPSIQRAYVANVSSNNVSVIDTQNDTLITIITVGINPDDLASVLSKNQVYVANSGENTVSIIDTVTNTVVATAAAAGPIFLADSCNEAYIFASCNGDSTITAIDTNNPAIVSTLPTGSSPMEAQLDCPQNFAYVAHLASASVTVFNPTAFTPVTSIPLNNAANQLRVSTILQQAYVTISGGTNQVQIINTTTNDITLPPIPFPGNPLAIAFNTDSTKAYVSDTDNNTVTIIDTASATAPNPGFAVGTEPRVIALVPSSTPTPPVPPNPPTPNENLLPPTQLHGFQTQNIFLTQRTTTNRLTWQPPVSGTPPTSYRIYRNSLATAPIAVVPASQLFLIDPIGARRPVTYLIVSVDAQCHTSLPARITI